MSIPTLTRAPALHLGSITTGSGRPLNSPEVQADLARALLSIPISQPAQPAREEQPDHKTG